MIPRFLLAVLLVLAALLATPLHAQVPAMDNTVVGTDSDNDGLWDDDYALFLYAMGAKGFLLPATYSKPTGSFVKDWRRHAGLPTWPKLNPDQRAYFSAWFWTYQELLASADKPARSLELVKIRNSWIGCYQSLHLPLKQMIGIGPFLAQVMQSRFPEARVAASQKAAANVNEQVFEPMVPPDAEACRALLQALPFKAYPEKKL